MSGTKKRLYQCLFKEVIGMSKTLYAFIMIVIALFGIGVFLYGLYAIWQPLAYVVGGLIMIGIAIAMNELYDHIPIDKGGDD